MGDKTELDTARLLELRELSHESLKSLIESDKTTVVHVENYHRDTIATNITSPDLTFDQFHGTFRQLS